MDERSQIVHKNEPIVRMFNMDKLSAILNRFSISAGVFYTGGLCGLSVFDAPETTEGHLHLLNSGRLEIVDGQGRQIKLEQPSLVFYPKPTRHQLIASEEDKARVVCASVRYGSGPNNPLANALPEVVVFPLAESALLKSSTEALFDEAFHERSGRDAMMNRLTEIFLIQLLRHVMDAGILSQGMLAGLSHPQLAKVITALHQAPEDAWTLETMAALAHMSRSTFAEQFRELLGQSPGDYLMEWRVAVAQNMLKKGKPVNLVANAVGYDSASALGRVFRKKTGFSPKQWLKQ